MSKSSESIQDAETADEFELGGSEALRLSESEELSILTGNSDDISSENCDSISEFEETLVGYQQNSEQEVAWVRTFVPPTVPESEIPAGMPSECKESVENGNRVAVEFLLPSRDYFWQTFRFPNKRWDPEKKLPRLLYTLSVSPGSLGNILGEQISVRYDRVSNSWGAELDSPGEDERKNECEENLVQWVNQTRRLKENMKLSLLVSLVAGVGSHHFIGVQSYMVFSAIFFALSIYFVLVYEDDRVDVEDWSSLLPRKTEQKLED